MGIAVLVPVKGFRQAKLRLAAALDPAAREALARRMASGVLAAAPGLPVFVVCDDEEVADFSRQRGAEVLWRPALGLNGAVADGVTSLARAGFSRVLVAHADLPLVVDLGWIARLGGFTLVPDRHDDGTNVICLPAREDFGFSYGPGSFRRHAAEGRRLGLAVRVVREPSLGWDVDVPDDLSHPSLQGVLPSLPTSPASPAPTGAAS